MHLKLLEISLYLPLIMFSYEQDTYLSLKRSAGKSFHYVQAPACQFRQFLQSKQMFFVVVVGVFCVVFFLYVFFWGGVVFFVIHYLIKTLFIMKIKTVIKTTHLVIKNYSPYQIRPDTVDLLFLLLLYNFHSLNLNIYMYCHFKTKTEH